MNLPAVLTSNASLSTTNTDQGSLTAVLILQKPLQGAEILIFKITLCMAEQDVLSFQISKIKVVLLDHSMKELHRCYCLPCSLKHKHCPHLILISLSSINNQEQDQVAYNGVKSLNIQPELCSDTKISLVLKNGHHFRSLFFFNFLLGNKTNLLVKKGNMHQVKVTKNRYRRV